MSLGHKVPEAIVFLSSIGGKTEGELFKERLVSFGWKESKTTRVWKDIKERKRKRPVLD